MSSLAQEILDAMPGDIDLVPMRVVQVSPLRIQMSGSSTFVPAESLSGLTLTQGATGFALWKPPIAPIVLALDGASSSGGGGGGGGGLAIYTHTQSNAANNWTINHNLGHDPIIEEVITTSGDIAEGFDVIHTSPGSQTVIGFDIAISGTARLA